MIKYKKNKDNEENKELKKQCGKPPTGVWGTVGLNDCAISVNAADTEKNRVY